MRRLEGGHRALGGIRQPLEREGPKQKLTNERNLDYIKAADRLKRIV